MPIQPEDRSVKVDIANGAPDTRGVCKVQNIRQKGIQGVGFGLMLGQRRSRDKDNQEHERQHWFMKM